MELKEWITANLHLQKSVRVNIPAKFLAQVLSKEIGRPVGIHELIGAMATCGFYVRHGNESCYFNFILTSPLLKAKHAQKAMGFAPRNLRRAHVFRLTEQSP